MAAPKGNKFAVGNNGGSPPFFDTQDELSAKVEEYFTYIKGEKKLTKMGRPSREWLRHPENPSITGLALFLGFESRQSFYDYEKREEFSYVIKRARLRIESSYEQHLLSKASTGAIFALKNFGWKDRQEVEHSGEMGITWHEVKTYDSNPKTNTGA